ncbi:MAG: hypothetical protein QW776_00430 [Candidatus Nitrosocaldus sp.]
MEMMNSANNVKRFAGLDLARIKDYSALVVIEVNNSIDSSNDDQGKTMTVVDAIEYPHIPLEDVAERIKGKYEEHRWSLLYIDATGFGGAVAYDILAAKNIPCRYIIFTNGMKNEMINNLITLIAGKRLKIPREYDRLIEQLLQQRRIVTSSSVKYEHPVGKHDDLFWALCLACIACKDAMDNEFIITSKKFSIKENLYGNYDAIHFREW